MRLIWLIPLLLIMLFHPSCRKIECDNSDITVFEGGFDSTELTNIRVNRYARGTNFSNQISSDSISFMDTSFPTANSNNPNGYKTIDGHFLYNQNLIVLDADVDWEIIFVLAARTYKISDINYHKDISDNRFGEVRESDFCSNGIDYYLNGTYFTIGRGNKGYSMRIELDK
jgi:hypothetical protein